MVNSVLPVTLYTAIDRATSRGFRALCPDGVDATRFLRNHSSLGSDVSHLAEKIELVASLRANGRIRVVQETYKLSLLLAEGYNHELMKSVWNARGG
jgi:hypothetical protein